MPSLTLVDTGEELNLCVRVQKGAEVVFLQLLRCEEDVITAQILDRSRATAVLSFTPILISGNRAAADGRMLSTGFNFGA